MKTVIVLPLPFDNWEEFEPFISRFCLTFKQHPPGVEQYELWAVCCWGQPTDLVREMFYGIKTRFVEYSGHGCDAGSHFAAAKLLSLECGQNGFLVGLTSRCYFHRAGWLRRFQEARERHGKGIYGAFGSYEGGLHICGRGYALDSNILASYQYGDDLNEGRNRWSEIGPKSITNWTLDGGFAAYQVTWDGERPLEDCRNAAETGIFRRGEQNCCLIWDRHTDIYRDASPELKRHLSRIADNQAV